MVVAGSPPEPRDTGAHVSHARALSLAGRPGVTNELAARRPDRRELAARPPPQDSAARPFVIARLRWARACLLVVGALASSLAVAPTAGASLQPARAPLTGQVGYSADGFGEADGIGTVQAVIPAGARVEQAFLYVTFHASATELDRTVVVDGGRVVTDTLPHSLQSAKGFNYSTSRAEVTNLVAGRAGGGGRIDFAIEYQTRAADGVALVVLYSGGDLRPGRIAVMDGGAEFAGTNTIVDLGGAVDPRVPGFEARLSLGIGFSFQGANDHACNDSQASIVNVNDRRLSSCAGAAMTAERRTDRS